MLSSLYRQQYKTSKQLVIIEVLTAKVTSQQQNLPHSMTPIVISVMQSFLSDYRNFITGKAGYKNRVIILRFTLLWALFRICNKLHCLSVVKSILNIEMVTNVMSCQNVCFNVSLYMRPCCLVTCKLNLSQLQLVQLEKSKNL